MLSKDLMNMAQELIVLWDMAYKRIKPEVEDIIKNHICDSERIDRCLEQILNIPTEKCYQLYIELCTYYATFNEQNAKEYLQIYDELYGEDDKLTRKKTK